MFVYLSQHYCHGVISTYRNAINSVNMIEFLSSLLSNSRHVSNVLLPISQYFVLEWERFFTVSSQFPINLHRYFHQLNQRCLTKIWLFFTYLIFLLTLLSFYVFLLQIILFFDDKNTIKSNPWFGLSRFQLQWWILLSYRRLWCSLNLLYRAMKI